MKQKHNITFNLIKIYLMLNFMYGVLLNDQKVLVLKQYFLAHFFYRSKLFKILYQVLKLKKKLLKAQERIH